MENSGAVARPSKWHVSKAVAVIAVLALAGSLCYTAYLKGAFRRTERVALVTTNQNSYWDPMALGAADAGREFGVDVMFVKSELGLDAQKKHIQDLLNGGIDALAICPDDPNAEASLINEAAAKMPVVTFDSDAPNTNRRGFIGSNNYAAGEVAADEVRNALPDGGQVLITMYTPVLNNIAARRQGLIDNLLNRRSDRSRPADPVDAELKGDKYEIVGTVVDGGDVDRAPELVAQAIKAHPDVKCIVGLSGYSGPTIVKAIDQVNKSGQIKVIGFDESPEEQALVASGKIYSSIVQNQYRCGYETVRILADQLHGIHDIASDGPLLAEMAVQVMRPDTIQEMRQSHTIRDVPATQPAI